jgi:hypothetical protein
MPVVVSKSTSLTVLFQVSAQNCEMIFLTGKDVTALKTIEEN